ncbi:MAG TPA: hypothetical protein VL588_11855 [Bdellovibrionota bacterium]|nr:hypothetical protein [Bdellovibrionota bacterium]
MTIVKSKAARGLLATLALAVASAAPNAAWADHGWGGWHDHGHDHDHGGWNDGGWNPPSNPEDYDVPRAEQVLQATQNAAQQFENRLQRLQAAENQIS